MKTIIPNLKQLIIKFPELIKLFNSYKSRSLGITFYQMVTYKVPYIDPDDINKKPTPKLPEEYGEYNNLLKK